MHKAAIFLTILLVAGFISIQWIDHASRQETTIDGSIMSERELEEYWIRYQCFKEVLDNNLDKLERGSVSLKDAHERVREAMTQWCPKHLDYLRKFEVGCTDDERIVRNLVGHIVVQNPPPRNAERIPVLLAEMEAYLKVLSPKR